MMHMQIEERQYDHIIPISSDIIQVIHLCVFMGGVSVNKSA